MPEHFSGELKELIAVLLSKDPSKRPMAAEILKYKFFSTD
jgi:hypothetical protein